MALPLNNLVLFHVLHIKIEVSKFHNSIMYVTKKRKRTLSILQGGYREKSNKRVKWHPVSKDTVSPPERYDFISWQQYINF